MIDYVAEHDVLAVVLSPSAGDRRGMAADRKLAVIGAGGEVVGAFGPAKEGEGRDRWAGPGLPAGPGLNRARWDPRADPATTFPGLQILGLYPSVGRTIVGEQVGETT